MRAFFQQMGDFVLAQFSRQLNLPMNMSVLLPTTMWATCRTLCPEKRCLTPKNRMLLHRTALRVQRDIFFCLPARPLPADKYIKNKFY